MAKSHKKSSMKHKKRTHKRHSKRRASRSKRSMRGGAAAGPSCVKPYAEGASMTGAGNMQASKDLDNHTMLYGNAVPLGNAIVGGGSKCGDDGVGTGHPKTETFKQYLESMDKQLGGGFSPDPAEYIAGNPVIKGYDDCCPPAIVGGKLMFGAPDQPLCGQGAVRGGARKAKGKSKKTKKHSRRSHRHSRRSHRHSRRSHRHSRRSHRRAQRGGDFTSLHSSKPADYATAFNGPMGVFRYPDDMKEREFGEHQPNYGVKAI
jgi:hypothetical protein